MARGLPSLLLGGVLKGDVLSGKPLEGSGAKLDLVAGSAECDFIKSLGLPARLMGGGMGGVDAGVLLLSKDALLRGSAVESVADVDWRTGLDSRPGVPLRLGILNLAPLECGELGADWSSEVRGGGRNGRGDCRVPSRFLAGEGGEWTSTLGGDLVLALGGVGAIIDVGRLFGVLHGGRSDLPRGVVAETVPL